jgi:acylphosphatase
MGMRLMIEGRVQGVGYRAWAHGHALRLRLDGWVRNRSEGGVELIAHGSEEALAALEQLCRRGPTTASVMQVMRTEHDGPVGTGFSQQPTV